MPFPSAFYCATYERTQFDRHVPAPLFRTQFELAQVPEEAPLVIAGLGFYDLWVNGQKITKGYLAPYISNPDDLVYYDRYELAEHLTAGQNVIGVVLGNGFQNNIDTIWDFHQGRHNGAPRFALELTLPETTITAGQFVTHPSPITFDNYRCGTHYDARLEQEGWATADYDASDWRPVLPAETPRGEPRFCEAEPIVVMEELKPVEIRKGQLVPHFARGDIDAAFQSVEIVDASTDEDNGFIYDFGINTAGIFRLRIQGEPGQRIVIDCGERLKDGKLDPTNISFFYPEGYGQRDIYICKGGEVETFVPDFTYHGGRYLYVSGITEAQATEDLLTFLVMHSDVKERAQFRASDETLNTLWTLARRSDLANFYYFPTDCPHREKNGWTGDASISAEHMLMTLEVETSFREWMRSVCRAQAPSGMLPGIVPTTGWGFEWGNGPAWDSVLFELPYRSYLYTGDTQIVSESAPNMLRYLNYIDGQRDEDGIIAIGLGDWCPVGRGPDDYLIPLGLSDSLMVMNMCHKAAFMFDLLGQANNRAYAERLGAELRTYIRAKYLDPYTMLLQGNCQSSQAMAIALGLLDSSEIAPALQHLIAMIEANDRAMDVGFLGGRVLFHVLSEYGFTDLALHMITKPSYPSYGHLLERGATSLWEMFLPEPQLSGSENHHFWGDISHWMLRRLCGINVNPERHDPNHILVKPGFTRSLDWVEGDYQAPGGRLGVRWEPSSEGMTLMLHVDAKLSVSVELPLGFTFADDGRSYRDGVTSGSYLIQAPASF